VRVARQDHLEQDREDDAVLQHLPQARRRVVTTKAQEPLRPEADRQEERQAEDVVQVIVDEPAADVMGLEVPPPQRVARHGREAERVGGVAEWTAGAGHVI
jgi:hypothetical protein